MNKRIMIEIYELRKRPQYKAIKIEITNKRGLINIANVTIEIIFNE